MTERGLKDRILLLEEKVMYLEHTVSDLNSVVSELNRHLSLLRDEWRDLRTQIGPVQAEDEFAAPPFQPPGGSG